jgi:hypothetical protein
MKTAYYFLMEPSKELKGGGVTAFMMRRIGEMGVASFDTPGESDNHLRHCSQWSWPFLSLFSFHKRCARSAHC